MREATRVISSGICAFIIGGLTITVSLAINSAMMASFDAIHPEKTCRKKKALQKWLYVCSMIIIAILIFWFISRFTSVRNADFFNQLGKNEVD